MKIFCKYRGFKFCEFIYFTIWIMSQKSKSIHQYVFKYKKKTGDITVNGKAKGSGYCLNTESFFVKDTSAVRYLCSGKQEKRE